MKKEKAKNKYRISTAIIIVFTTIHLISYGLAFLLGVEFLLLLMLSGGIAGAAIEYKWDKQKKEPFTEKDRQELMELIKQLNNSNEYKTCEKP